VTACMSASPNRSRPIGDHFNGTYVPVEEPSTASRADLCTVVMIFKHQTPSLFFSSLIVLSPSLLLPRPALRRRFLFK
jgi:hypothetical protein